jgi:hypothetical protein
VGGGWSLVWSIRHWGHQWPIVPDPGDYDDGEIGGMIGRGNRSTRKKTCRSAALFTTYPTRCPDANPGRRKGKLVTNSLSYGLALAQAVSRRLPTAAARVQTRVWSSGILWWTKVALGQVFFRVLRFPQPIYIPSASPQSSSLSPQAGTIGQEWL